MDPGLSGRRYTSCEGIFAAGTCGSYKLLPLSSRRERPSELDEFGTSSIWPRNRPYQDRAQTVQALQGRQIGLERQWLFVRCPKLSGWNPNAWIEPSSREGIPGEHPRGASQGSIPGG